RLGGREVIKSSDPFPTEIPMSRTSRRVIPTIRLLTFQAVTLALFTGSSLGASAQTDLVRLRNIDREIARKHLSQGEAARALGPIRYVAPDVEVIETVEPPATSAPATTDEVEDYLRSSRPGSPGMEANFVNGRFELNNFTGWTTRSFLGIATPGCGASTSPVHAFITNAGLLPLTGNDPALNARYEGTHSCRLGDDTPWGTSGPKCSSISQDLVVDATNHFFTFAYAVMAANPGGNHSPQDSPYFDILVERISPSQATIYHVND